MNGGQEKTLIGSIGDSVKHNAINRPGTNNKGNCVLEKRMSTVLDTLSFDTQNTHDVQKTSKNIIFEVKSEIKTRGTNLGVISLADKAMKVDGMNHPKISRS